MMNNNFTYYTFEELVVSYDAQLLTTERAGDDLYLSTSNGGAVLELNGLRICPGCSYDEKVMLELYSAADNERLCMTQELPYDKEVSMVIDGQLLRNPGKYYILIYNAVPREKMQHRFDEYKGAYRYTFYLLENGERLLHPSLKGVSLSADLKLDLTWNTAQTELDRYDVAVYNSDWELMAKAERLSFCSSHFKTALSSPFLWCDGDYFMLLSHNGEPFLCVDFNYKNGVAGQYTWATVNRLSPYYVLAKYFRRDIDWQRWQAVPGAATIRKMLVRQYVHHAFDLMRLNHGLSECLEKTHHAAIIVEEETFDKSLLRNFSKLTNPQLLYMEKNCSDLLERTNDATPGATVKGVVDDWSSSVLCLHHLSALQMPGGSMLIKAVEECLLTNHSSALILVGTKSEVNQVIEASAVIGKFVKSEHFYCFDKPTFSEQIHWIQRQLMEKGISLSGEAGKKLLAELSLRHNRGEIWNTEQLKRWMSESVFARFAHRILSSTKQQLTKETLSTIEADDISFPDVEQKVDTFTECMEALQQMVGLEKLKHSMKSLLCRSRMDEKRRRMGLPVNDSAAYHMVFTGNPGTGKTTVARMIGRVFHALGILSKGGVIVTERSKLVGRYIGDTENNVQALLEQAKGNVLFIDEAYNLCDDASNKRDFGHRVIDSLLTLLSQKHPDVIVILAGYAKEMNQMLESNPGMKGRFPYHFHFEDYNAEELVQIAHNLLSQSAYILTPQAGERLAQIVAEVVDNKDAFFHNARWIEQFIQNGILMEMSERLANLPVGLESKELYQTIEVEDIESAYLKLKSQTTIKKIAYRRIGFVA